MSQTFILVCHEKKSKIWIGQGLDEMTSFYSGNDLTMAGLKQFLNDCRDEPCYFMCDGDAPAEVLDAIYDYKDYTELEPLGPCSQCQHSNPRDPEHNEGPCRPCDLILRDKFKRRQRHE